MAWLAVLAAGVVGLRAWSQLPAELPAAGATPACSEPVEVLAPVGSRLGCARDPLLRHCPRLRAGDRVAVATCEVEHQGMDAKMRMLAGLPIDLNRATAADLELLPGIGPVLAGAIVAERGKAPFSSVDDLIRVRGIGPAKLSRARPFVTAGPR